MGPAPGDRDSVTQAVSASLTRSPRLPPLRRAPRFPASLCLEGSEGHGRGKEVERFFSSRCRRALRAVS